MSRWTFAWLAVIAAACGGVSSPNADAPVGIVDGPVADGPVGAIDAPRPDAARPDAAAIPCQGTVVPGTPTLVRESLGSFTQPVLVISPPNDPRIFVVQKNGEVHIVGETTAFLDINVQNSGEQGLLGMAFAPDYATSRKFYVHYSEPGTGDTIIEQILASEANPNVADMTTRTQVLTVDQPFSNHNGGHIQFGPDGYLYIGLGDGGSGGDPEENGQDTNALLGKLLRIDVSSLPYSIPPGNPFAAGGGAPEIWAIGLRNPWRWSFDDDAGLIYIADVGQNQWEEVHIESTTAAGLNYGWDDMEGAHCYEPSSGCAMAGREIPQYEYSHATGGCSITGGYVYRGCRMPDLQGTYFFSDYCTGIVQSFRWNGSAVTELTTHDDLSGGSIVGFGEDAQGEMYITTLGGGVYRIVPAP